MAKFEFQYHYDVRHWSASFYVEAPNEDAAMDIVRSAHFYGAFQGVLGEASDDVQNSDVSLLGEVSPRNQETDYGPLHLSDLEGVDTSAVTTVVFERTPVSTPTLEPTHVSGFAALSRAEKELNCGDIPR